MVAMLPNALINGDRFKDSPEFFSNQSFGNFHPPPFRNPFKEHFFEFLAVLSLTLMLKINSRLKLAEKQKVNAELSYLKAQINPHFLFNTLNSIYSLAIEKSDYTATAVLKLSGMMRYVITDVNNKFVPLEKEINYLSDYIELQKIRLDNTIKVDYFVMGDTADKEIAPLVLISFIENAFKYGVNAEENSEIKIQITITKAYLHLSIFNNKVHIHPINTTKSGLGIENTKQRLQLLYPGNHKLIIKDNKDDFSVLLSLYLK
jgi:sensor histidine kinase YesM